ncbi:MAG TPA: plastocyanin/azurin family copper-binding protein, partial [Gemmatimonadales bacterium]|nr:plastocyanin/azurin family copper-binding protein [Gemmatimonadales bacterium]
CGGEKKAEQQGTADQQQATPAPDTTAAAPAAGGATHDVNMVLEGSAYKFVPAELTIKAGDVVRFHNVSGGPHNVAFWPESIPSGAQQPLDAGIADKMGPLQSNLVAEPNAVITVNFANAPAGEYKYYCLPHLALGMKGKITVQ